MNGKRSTIFICILLVSIPVCTSSISADPEHELKVGLFGGSILTGLKRAGGVIFNGNEDYAVYDIHYTLEISGGLNDSINISIPGYIEEILPNQAVLQSTNEVKGFGPVTMTMTVTSSNAGESTEIINGFQIGPYTISQIYVLAWYRVYSINESFSLF